MTEWEFMTEIAKANNNGDDERMSQLILENDFQDMKQAITMLFSCFQLTKENIKTHISAAKKLSKFDAPESYRESIRHSMLSELIKEIQQ